MKYGLALAGSGRKLWLFLEVHGPTDASCTNIRSAFVHLDFGVLLVSFAPLKKTSTTSSPYYRTVKVDTKLTGAR